MGEEKRVKSHFKMKITTLKRQEGEDTNPLKVINEEWVSCRRTDFVRSLRADADKGIEHKIEMVKATPVNFQINTIYIRLDGEIVWIFREE